MSESARGAGPLGLRRAAALAALGWLACGVPLSGCYAPQMALLKSGLDSLRTVVDTVVVRDSVAYTVLRDTRQDLAEQRDILLSTRATSGTTTQELFDQMTRLEGRLDEVLTRFQQIAQRATPPTPTGSEMNQIYDQASGDLTQGRYSMALQGFRDFLQKFPTSELADNAQYGVGECFFAQSVFDSAEVEYARVETQYPSGDKVPAALYKLGLTRERLGRTAAARKTFEDLLRRFPNAGEAPLARERLGGRSR
jgi:tol-pal system protein YbgF